MRPNESRKCNAETRPRSIRQCVKQQAALLRNVKQQAPLLRKYAKARSTQTWDMR